MVANNNHPPLNSDEEYEQAITFLRNFHSRPAVTLEESSCPLGLGAFTVVGYPTKIRKTVASMCLVNMDTSLEINRAK